MMIVSVEEEDRVIGGRDDVEVQSCRVKINDEGVCIGIQNVVGTGTEPVKNNGKPNNVAGDVVGKEPDVVNVSKDVENNGGRSKDMAKEQNERCKTDFTNGKRTYANVGTEKQDFSRKLFAKPIEVDEEGNVFAVFDDEILSEGCKKWDKT
ncbi:hypothetical protein Tco_0621890, partial [Tanacetum coccineum]